MNKFVKIEGYSIWFLLLETVNDIPESLSERMREQILRSEVCALHNPDAKGDFIHRVIMVATGEIDYKHYVKAYGPILVQKVGSFMPLFQSKIIETRLGNNFPIEDFAEVVICENDKMPDYKWLKYLVNRFPDKSITTINFFDLRTEEEVAAYFEKAKYITFSTTFSDMGWFEKLARHVTTKHTIIGKSSDEGKWDQALAIQPLIEIIK